MRTTALMLAAIIALSILAPTGLAQSQTTVQRLDVTLQGFIDDPQLDNNRILPETTVAKVRVEALLNVNMYSRSASCSTPVQLEFGVTAPSYATAVMVPTSRTLVIPGSSSGSQASWQAFPVDALLEITVGRDAPAFVDGLYVVTVQATSQPNVQGGTSSCDLGTSAPTSGTYRLKNDFTPRTSIDAAEVFASAGPNEKVVFPIKLDNIGNGPSRVKVTLQPSGNDAFRAYSAGPEVRLASPSSGDGTSRTILVEVTTPATWGYTNDLSTLTATVTTIYDGVAPGTTFQESTEITFTVQTQGAYVSVFGLPTFLGILIFLGLAFVAGIYGGKSLQVLRTRREEKKALKEANTSSDRKLDRDDTVTDDRGFDENATPGNEPIDSELEYETMTCPKCAMPTEVPVGSEQQCSNCGWS